MSEVEGAAVVEVGVDGVGVRNRGSVLGGKACS